MSRSLDNFNMSWTDVIDLLDQTISKTVDLCHLDVLLNMKLSIFNTPFGSRRINLNPNLELTHETVDFDLLINVLKKGFQMCEYFSDLFENIAKYITAKHTDINCQGKVIMILNHLVCFCIEDNKMYLLSDYLKSEFICNVLLKALHNIETKAQSYETLTLYFTVLPKENQIKCLNEIFDFCSQNKDLDIFCALLNHVPDESIHDKSCCCSDADFLIYVEACISGSVSHLQKQGKYVLSKYIDSIQSKQYVNAIADWIKIKDSWEVLFMLLDIGREKQLHLVTPALNLFKRIWIMPFLWQKCICKIYLQHSQTVIVNKVAMEILEQRFSGDNLKETFHILFPAINKDEYTELSCKMFQKLQKFCAGLSKNDIDIVVTELIKISWTPGSFWKVIQNVFSTENCHNINIDLLQEVIRCAVNLPHIYIRTECIKYLIHFFHNEKDQGKICKLAIYLKSSDERNFQYLKKCLNSGEIVALVINELLQSDDNVRACFLILKNTDTHMYAYLKEHLDKSSPHASLLLSYINLSHPPHSGTLCSETETILVEYFRKYLSEKTTETFIEVLKLCLSEFQLNHHNTRIVVDGLLTHSKEYNRFHIYVALVLCQVNRVESKLGNGLLLRDSEGLMTINFSSDYYLLETTIRLKDPSCCSESINLFFKLNKSYSLNTTKKIIEIFTKAFESHDNKVLYGIYENLHYFFVRSESQNLVVDFFNICHRNLLHIKKDKYYTSIVSKFIETIYSTEYLSVYGNNISVINDDLLEISKLNLVIRHNWIESLHSAIIEHHKVCWKPALEIYLLGLVITKNERAEFHICQEFLQNTTQTPLTDNPNILNLNVRKIAYWTLVTMGNVSSTELLIRHLRERYTKHFTQRYFPDSRVHHEKLRILQLIMGRILEQTLSEEQNKDLSFFAFDCLVQETNQSCVRQFLNWILILTLKQVGSGTRKISEWIQSRRISPAALTNIMPAISHLVMFEDENTLEETLTMTLPWIMGAQFKLRVYAQDLIRRIIQHAREQNYENFLNRHAYLEKSIISCIESTGDAFINTMRSDRVFLNDFHPVKNGFFSTIFYDIPRLNRVCPTEWQNLFVGYRFSTFGHAIDAFLSNDKHNSEQDIEAQPDQMSHIQKKITPWKSSMANTTTEAKSDFILVASLIDKAQNLGGLSRTCEVFGIRTVVFNDAKIINDKEFKSLSLSSEAWINATEVKIKDLMEYVLSLQKEGYRVVGAEQTAGSKKLNEFSFPRKTALILGNEKTGISPELIPLLDECLEIPQFGQTRSLNVHVAGATFIWEYAKQHLV